MIFTLYYMYATLLQWWRLGSLKNKLNGTLNAQNALLVCNENVIHETSKERSLENLLFRCGDRIGCTIVPKRKINLSSQWIVFPKQSKFFPIYFSDSKQKIESPTIYVLIQAILETYSKHQSEILQVENFGDLMAWRISENFEAILKTDIDKLTKFVHCYSQSTCDINHELELLKIETVNIEGTAAIIKYDRQFSLDSSLKYSYLPVHWQQFVSDVKDLYAKIRDVTNPKITIENGTNKIKETKHVLVSDSKTIKRDIKKVDDKNTLEVSSSDHRRHKTNDQNKKDKTIDKHKDKTTSRSTRDTKTNDLVKDTKQKDPKNTSEKEHKSKNKEETPKKPAEITKESLEIKEEDVNTKKSKDLKTKEHKTSTTKPKSDTDKYSISKSSKEMNSTSKTGKHHAGSSKISKEVTRASSKEKKLVKTPAICEPLPTNDTEDVQPKRDHETNENALTENLLYPQTNGSVINKSVGTVKPPNILVYADSILAKDNVKSVLSTILNKDKYTIYDLPTHNMWYDSTVLVVVCGTVPPNLTFHLLQFLLHGGQLLCLCSDLLYSVLHTFTTAEVREHELVRFTYGEWKQVKMMHHIFCYQASPAKKQFSKDSDNASNHSSGNGSSPVAPRTPSTVDIQHNGKDYTIQVQVLGTEETWQTPSLLLATVKGSKGRAIFSQVHLEINPSQYEDDETKFEALKGSDKARLEILRDILSNHLDVDCDSKTEFTYTPAYFLGRHDLKLTMLSECVSANQMTCGKLSVAFCGKDDKFEPPSDTFLPILIHSCPTNFSTVAYFEALSTEQIGRLVIYSDVLTSTQIILNDKTLAHGLAVIARQQSSGIGRSSNFWISPLGCAMFSLQIHIPLDSPLGRVLSFVQQLVMVAVISAVKKMSSEDINIGIKWPNDLYANGNVKVGGLIVNSSTSGDTAILNIGCGINLDNSNPTTCINDLIKTFNSQTGKNIKPIEYETLFAVIFNEVENLLKSCQKGDMDCLYDRYYKYWLHGDSNITISSKDGSTQNVRIVGIDNFGFLKVRSESGSIIVVQPDGNTFDMMKGLISPKNF